MCGAQLSRFAVQHAYPAGHPRGRSGYHAKKGKLSEALVGPASADGHQGAAESNAQWLPHRAMVLDVSNNKSRKRRYLPKVHWRPEQEQLRHVLMAQDRCHVERSVLVLRRQQQHTQTDRAGAAYIYMFKYIYIT